MASYIEFPIFTGVAGDLRPWISWLEAFFVREKFTADEKMNLAQSLLEGEANAWFYRSQKRFSFQSWEHLHDLLIWRFGDLSDPALFLLWDKNERLLQAQRRKRMATASLNLQDSISSPAMIQETIPVDKFFTPQVAEISGEKTESKKEVESQVHVSDSENLRNIDTMAENSVLDSFETVVMKAKIQKNIRIDVVNGDVERIQSVMSITKTVSAHQVLDKTSPHKDRLKSKSKRMLSLSPKTWMFKFKNKNLQHNWSQWELLQVIDRSKINNMYLCFGVNSELVRNKRTFQCLGLQKQAHKSRVLYHLRMLHDPGGKKDEHFDEIFETEVDIGKVQRTQMGIVAESVLITPDNVASSTDVITKRQIHDGAVVKYSEPATYAQAMHTDGWDEACDAEIDALEGTGTCFVTSIFNEGLKTEIQEVLKLKAPVDVISLVFLDLKKCLFQGAAKRDVQMMLLVKATDAHVDSLMCGDVTFFLKHKWRFKFKGRLKKIKLTNTMFLWEKVHMVSCLSFDAQFHSLEFQLKHKWRSKHLYTMSALEFQVVERIGVMVFQDQPLPREIVAELDSFAPVFVIVLLVLVDRLSKAVHVLGLKHPFKPGWVIGVHQQGVLIKISGIMISLPSL